MKGFSPLRTRISSMSDFIARSKDLADKHLSERRKLEWLLKEFQNKCQHRPHWQHLTGAQNESYTECSRCGKVLCP